jgi:beta-ribofuranosylaminobenzene 5'-phosphate synthase
VSAAVAVRSPSRLHFGLLSFPAGPHWPNRLGQQTVPARRFGGVGLMVQAPGVRVAVRPAPGWSAEGPLAERALEYARRFAQATPQPGGGPFQPHHLVVEHCPPEHAGLGTGTQMGLAVGKALAVSCDVPNLDAVELARRVGRGARSALGIHGFTLGGFLVEGGKGKAEAVAPLVARVPFPETWPIVLVLPGRDQGVHGTAESRAFERLQVQGMPLGRTDALCRLVLLGMLPALAEQDVHAFGEALYDFNCLAGEAFAAVQGGLYASPRVVELVAFMRQQGTMGVGQSSWGPSAFAVAGEDGQADDLAARIRHRFALQPEDVLTTRACNHGAVIDRLDLLS